MNKKILLLSITLLLVITKAERFELLANFNLSQEAIWEKIASIELNVEETSGYIQSDRLQLIPRDIIQKASKTNRFIQLKLTRAQDSGREFLSTLDLLQNFPSGEFKEVIEVNVDSSSNINSFSYVVKPTVSTKRDIKNELIDEDIDEAFRLVVNKQNDSLKSMFQPSSKSKTHSNQAQGSSPQQQQKQQQQQQQEAPQSEGGIMGIIKDNFWYIIIGLVAINLVSGFDTKEGAGAGRPAAPATK